LIVKKFEIYKIQKCTQFWHKMLKIASVSGAPPQTLLRELTTLPRPPVAKGFLLPAIAASRLRHSQFDLLRAFFVTVRAGTAYGTFFPK